MVSCFNVFLFLSFLQSGTELNVNLVFKTEKVNYKYAYFIVSQTESKTNEIVKLKIPDRNVQFRKELFLTAENYNRPVLLVLSNDANLVRPAIYKLPRISFIPEKIPVTIEIGDANTSVVKGGELNNYFKIDEQRKERYSSEEIRLIKRRKLATYPTEKKAMDSVNFSSMVDYAVKYPHSPFSIYNLYDPLSFDYISAADALKIYTNFDNTVKASNWGKKLSELISRKLNNLKVGDRAPSFVLKDQEGKNISLNDFAGRYLLIDFWASWCGPCRAENPNLVAAYNKLKSKSFSVLSVSLDKNRDQWLKAIKQDNLQWSHVITDEGFQSGICAEYAIDMVPSNFLIDPSGKIIAKNIRGKLLTAALTKLLQ